MASQDLRLLSPLMPQNTQSNLQPANLRTTSGLSEAAANGDTAETTSLSRGEELNKAFIERRPSK